MISLTPEVVFYLFGLPITNTVVSTWVMMLIIIIIAGLIRFFKPSAGEIILEFISSIIRSVMPEDVNISKYLPVLGTMAMVSPTANINTTIALAAVIFFAVHVYGISEKGLLGYLKDFANPIFILPLEIVSQFSRTLSLSVRLFGNILSTDLIVVIVFSLIPFILPIPLAALGMLTGVLQAYIFIVLASLYIASAIEVKEMEEERRKYKQELSESS